MLRFYPLNKSNKEKINNNNDSITKNVIMYSLKWTLILDQLDRIHKEKIKVVKTMNNNETLSIPK